MIATLRRSYTFEAAHRLPSVPEGHKCGNLHGHSYRVTVLVRGPVQTEGPHAGMVMDFARVDGFVAPLVKQLDHSTLNDHQGLENPTSEHLGRWFVWGLRHALPHFLGVEVAETCRSSCLVLADEVES